MLSKRRRILFHAFIWRSNESRRRIKYDLLSFRNRRILWIFHIVSLKQWKCGRVKSRNFRFLIISPRPVFGLIVKYFTCSTFYHILHPNLLRSLWERKWKAFPLRTHRPRRNGNKNASSRTGRLCSGSSSRRPHVYQEWENFIGAYLVFYINCKTHAIYFTYNVRRYWINLQNAFCNSQTDTVYRNFSSIDVEMVAYMVLRRHEWQKLSLSGVG